MTPVSSRPTAPAASSMTSVSSRPTAPAASSMTSVGPTTSPYATAAAPVPMPEPKSPPTVLGQMHVPNLATPKVHGPMHVPSPPVPMHVPEPAVAPPSQANSIHAKAKAAAARHIGLYDMLPQAENGRIERPLSTAKGVYWHRGICNQKFGYWETGGPYFVVSWDKAGTVCSNLSLQCDLKIDKEKYEDMTNFASAVNESAKIIKMMAVVAANWSATSTATGLKIFDFEENKDLPGIVPHKMLGTMSTLLSRRSPAIEALEQNSWFNSAEATSDGDAKNMVEELYRQQHRFWVKCVLPLATKKGEGLYKRWSDENATIKQLHEVEKRIQDEQADTVFKFMYSLVTNERVLRLYNETDLLGVINTCFEKIDDETHPTSFLGFHYPSSRNSTWEDLVKQVKDHRELLSQPGSSWEPRLAGVDREVVTESLRETLRADSANASRMKKKNNKKPK